MIETRVDRRMIIEVLAIINGGFFDFTDCGVDFTNRFLLFMAQLTSVSVLEVSTGGAKICQSVKIFRMFALRVGLVRGKREN